MENYNDTFFSNMFTVLFMIVLSYFLQANVSTDLERYRYCDILNYFQLKINKFKQVNSQCGWWYLVVKANITINMW